MNFQKLYIYIYIERERERENHIPKSNTIKYFWSKIENWSIFSWSLFFSLIVQLMLMSIFILGKC